MYLEDSKVAMPSKPDIPRPESPKADMSKPILTDVKTIATRNLQTGHASGFGATIEDSKCPQCEDPSIGKHFLDCSHGLCPTCAKLQLEVMMATRHGLMEFVCKACRAPKFLSTRLHDRNRAGVA